MRGAKHIRALVPLLLFVFLTSCAGRGINAGEQGGRAFVAFAVMLLAALGLLYLSVGRGD